MNHIILFKQKAVFLFVWYFGLKPGSTPTLSVSLGKHECDVFAIWNSLKQGGSVSSMIFTFVSEWAIRNWSWNLIGCLKFWFLRLALVCCSEIWIPEKNNAQCLRYYYSYYYCYCAFDGGGGAGADLLVSGLITQMRHEMVWPLVPNELQVMWVEVLMD
jgi:hypothetical protein